MAFNEKPERPTPMPTLTPIAASHRWGSTSSTRTHLSSTSTRTRVRASAHDFGKNIIPTMIRKGAGVYAYNFVDENRKEAKYWRDVGTIDEYWEANLDLVCEDPLLNLYDNGWPIRTYQAQNPAAKFVFAQQEIGGRLGIALDSIVAHGCILGKRRPGAELSALTKRTRKQLQRGA